MRRLVRADLEWVVDVAAARRARLVPYAPRFWHPAPGARAAHTEFLGGLIDSPEVLAVRTAHGFLFGLPRDGQLLVDDLALSVDEYWPTEGEALLRRAAQDGPLRVVCPVPEEARRAAATSVGLSVVETWWHRELDADGLQPGRANPDLPEPEPEPEPGADADRDGESTAEDAQLRVAGAEGRLVPAPPIYAPGGPVLLVNSMDSRAALHELERLAAWRGARVAVVSLPPEDGTKAAAVKRAGYRRTTDFLQ